MNFYLVYKVGRDPSVKTQFPDNDICVHLIIMIKRFIQDIRECNGPTTFTLRFTLSSSMIGCIPGGGGGAGGGGRGGTPM